MNESLYFTQFPTFEAQSRCRRLHLLQPWLSSQGGWGWPPGSLVTKWGGAV